jgi:hypothetical protein
MVPRYKRGFSRTLISGSKCGDIYGSKTCYFPASKPEVDNGVYAFGAPASNAFGNSRNGALRYSFLNFLANWIAPNYQGVTWRSDLAIYGGQDDALRAS